MKINTDKNKDGREGKERARKGVLTFRYYFGCSVIVRSPSALELLLEILLVKSEQ